LAHLIRVAKQTGQLKHLRSELPMHQLGVGLPLAIKYSPEMDRQLERIDVLAKQAEKNKVHAIIALKTIAAADHLTAKKVWKKLKIEVLSLRVPQPQKTKLEVGEVFLYLPDGGKYIMPTEKGSRVLLTTHDISKKLNPHGPPPPAVLIKRTDNGYKVIAVEGGTENLLGKYLRPGKGFKIGKMTIFFHKEGRQLDLE